MQNPEELLTQLKDIELPAANAFAVAPGWVVLFALLLLLLYAAYRLWLAHKRRLNHWRIPARASLDNITQQIMADDRKQVLAECSKLARRVVLAREPRAEISALTGTAWLEKLDQLAGGQFFTQGHGQLLANGPYQSEAVTDARVLQDITTHLRQLIDAPEKQSQQPSQDSSQQLSHQQSRQTRQ